jgi:hypothetical protein
MRALRVHAEAAIAYLGHTDAAWATLLHDAHRQQPRCRMSRSTRSERCPLDADAMCAAVHGYLRQLSAMWS